MGYANLKKFVLTLLPTPTTVCCSLINCVCLCFYLWFNRGYVKSFSARRYLGFIDHDRGVLIELNGLKFEKGVVELDSLFYDASA